MSNPRAGAFPSRMDDAFNLVGELFSAANATLSQATGQVLHKMTGGKLDGSEVEKSMTAAGQSARAAMDEVKKRTEELPKIFGPRPPSSDDDFRADPELHHLFATLPISRTKSNKDVLDELDKAIKSKPKMEVRASGKFRDDALVGMRYISTIDPEMARAIREDRAGCVQVSKIGVAYFAEPASQLVLPSFEGYPPELRSLVLRNLVEQKLQSKAEANEWINSSLYCNRQYILNTVGDGNCLSNACSLGVWGVNDRDKQLRRLIKESMTSSAGGREIQKRFNYQLANQGLGPGDCDKEWRTELAVFEDDRKYLSDVHCFVLANVLRRPIIMYGDTTTMMGGLAGIYLPLLWDPIDCSSIPISVLYNESHYSLLCVIEGESPSGDFPLIQLTTAGGQQLAVRFILPADGSEEQVLSKYMVVLTLPDGAEAAVFQGSANENALVQLMTAMMGASAGQVIT